jgi:hypothetical protein
MINYDGMSSNEIEEAFKVWFEDQVNKGLTNFGISLNENAKDPIEVKRQLLKTEQQIMNGDYAVLSEEEFDIDDSIMSEIKSFKMS